MARRNKLLATAWLPLVLLLCVEFVAAAPPAAPSQVTVVPRYDNPITLVVQWTDNSANEEGFAVARREQGGAYGPATVVAAGATSYVDSTAASDKRWEYRVRANHATEGNSAWVAAPNDSTPKQVWPINDGDKDILHGMGTPLNAGVNYHHEAYDISASGKRVDAARGGLITAINAGSGGTLRMNVDFGAGGVLGDSYLHIVVDATLGAGDQLAPGDRVGTVSTTYFSRDVEADHVHWGSDATNNLLAFTQNSDRDPNSQAPIFGDINNDSKDFIIVDAAANDHTAARATAWRDVDLLVDAYDDLSPNTNLMGAPFYLGYWIQSGITGGENVASATTPYVLAQFDFSLVNRNTHNTQGVYWNLPADIDGVNTWQTYLTWIITNTSGTTGAKANIDSSQFWRTDARAGSGARENRSDANRARENQEARFNDGTYFVRLIAKDMVNTTNAVRSLIVDNSRPYVQRVTVYSGASPVYQSQWVWDAATAQLNVQPATFDASAPFTALRTQDIKIEVEFSEPMTAATITSVSGFTGIPTLSSTQATHQRTIWSGLISNLDIADNGTNDGNHMITFNGTDLAGNSLLRINNRTAMSANHHNRDASGTLQGAVGTDTIHGFKVGPLSGVIPITAIFMKSGAADPATPTVNARATAVQQALNTYFSEVSYGEISFAVTGTGWYQLDNPIAWYYANPRSPLIDLVQEAIDDAETNGVTISDDNYVLVVTDETAARPEWSTNGGWPYDISAAPGWKLIAGGVSNLATSDPHLTNIAGRMVGLIDLFAYPEVTVARPFVGPWSHMSDKDNNVHVLGWEKWRMGWLDQTGTATGNTLTYVAKPPVATPITNRAFTLTRADTDSNSNKLVAIEIGDRLHYTAEYRVQQNLDSALPDDGVVITKANDYINQGEGTVIVQESPVTANNLADATFDNSAARDEFDDVGSGIKIEVISMNATEANIRLNYIIPPTQNDLYVSPHTNRWKALDIWVDAPDADDNYAADPLTLINANEKPVVGKPNKIYGRVRNQGNADATNFEVHLGIRTPWGAGGPWVSLNVDTVALLQGQANDPNAKYLISAEWTPTTDVHSCVKLEVVSAANDVNAANNWTQENIDQFDSISGSPYSPVVSRFGVENPYAEEITVFFKVDGLPENWSYIMSPERLVIPAKSEGNAQIVIQPDAASPRCSSEEITVSAYTPRVDTLKELGGITLQTGLKGPMKISHISKAWCRGQKGNDEMISARLFSSSLQSCSIETQGCTDPKLVNQKVAVIYTDANGDTQVHYVTTDENGCYSDVLSNVNPGLWESKATIEGDQCRADGTSPDRPVVVGDPDSAGLSPLCWVLWAVIFILFVYIGLLLIAAIQNKPGARTRLILALLLAIVLGYFIWRNCAINPCLFWLSLAIALLIACLIARAKSDSVSLTQG